MKFEPFKVSTTPEAPALTEEGVSDLRVGAGFDAGLIGNSAAPEFPPPGEGLPTLIAAEPMLAMSAAVTCAFN